MCSRFTGPSNHNKQRIDERASSEFSTLLY
jgi:hypothetical protein